MADFYKYHSLGNDYIIIDPRRSKLDLRLNKATIKLICNRNYGIGSDGILFGPIVNNHQITFQIFNPDGSEAERSGNGIMIFALYVYNHGYVKTRQFDLHTKAGRVSIDIIDLQTNSVRVSIEKYSFLSNKIPTTLSHGEVLNQEVILFGKKEIIHCVNVGNSHCVLIKDEISEQDMKNLGPILENHQLFPNRINVQLVKILDRSNINIEIWERGVGYTLSSGTSSLSASCVAYKLNYINNDVMVNMKGGSVRVKIMNNNLFLIGSVREVFKGMFQEDMIKKIINDDYNKKEIKI